MKNDFKYLTAFAAAFVSLLFVFGTFMNFSRERYQMALTTGAVASLFIFLSIVFYKRAQKKGIANFIEEQRMKAEEQATSKVKLPAKYELTATMKPETVKIIKLIHLAIDQAIEHDYIAAEIILKQAENQVLAHPNALHEKAWKHDIGQIRGYILEKGGAI